MKRSALARALPLFDELLSEGGHDNVLNQIRNFSAFGNRTLEKIENGIPYFINEFWTSGQRQGHSLHEISYRACFKAELPEFFIERLTCAGELVADPFMGRGTTVLQAALMGRRAAGNDINPLSQLLIRPRLQPPKLQDIAKIIETIPWKKAAEPQRTDLLAFYGPKTLARIELLRQWILDNAPLGEHCPNPIVDWIRMVALNRLTGHSSGFFSGRTMPPNQAVSLSAQEAINRRLGTTAQPERDLAQIILKKSRSLLRDQISYETNSTTLTTDSADNTSLFRTGSVSLVVTSPPFLDIVQYANDNWLRCWFADIDTEKIKIASHKSESDWQAMVRRVLVEQARILRPGGHVAFEVGEVRGGKVLLERLVWEAASALPFERLGVVVNAQEFTKTANCWGVSNGTKGTNTNRIVLLRRI
jgi:hypothetical protein